LYLPIRANMDGNFYDFSKIFNATKPNNGFSGFRDYIFRTDYADYGGQFLLMDKVHFFTAFLYNLWHQFYWLLIFAVVGIGTLWSRGKRFIFLTASIFVLNVLAIILLRSSKWNFDNEFLYSFYYLPAYSITALWIGMGIAFLYKLASVKTGLIKLQALNLIILIFPVILFSKNLETQNLSKFNFSDEYTKQILLNLPPNAFC
jgi:hypothetical protein